MAVGAVQQGQEVVWGARPEYLGWSTSHHEDAIAGTVTILEHLGASVLVTVDAGEDRIQLVVDDEQEPAVGTSGWVVASARQSLLFGEDGELINAGAGSDEGAGGARAGAGAGESRSGDEARVRVGEQLSGAPGG